MKKKLRSGFDLGDWFRENHESSLEDFITELKTDPHALRDKNSDLPTSDIRRVWTLDELRNADSIYLTPPLKHEPAPDPPATAQPNIDDTNRIDDFLSWSKPDKDGNSRLLLWVKNLKTIFTQHAEWRDKIRLNDRDRCVYLFPGTPITKNISERQKLEDNHYTDAIEWIESKFSVSFKKTMVADALQSVGQLQSYDPVRDYFDSLRWDNQVRSETWLTEISGAEDSEYTRAVSKRFLISVVARTYEPGCKVDTMLILSGKQGNLKSTLFSTLAGPRENFTDHLEKITSKDARMQIQGPMLIEMAELSNLSRAEVEDVKQFLSTQEDRFRPPYGRNDIFCPRRCVFVGTTNETNYLRDSTGARRFWPVSVNKIDLQKLSSMRDQLWAEAVELYRIGYNWWLSDAEEKLAKKHQRDAGEVGAYDEVIYNYICKPVTAMSKTDWTYCFEQDGRRWGISVQEIFEMMDLSARDVQATSKTIQKAIERIIGTNETKRKTINTMPGRPRFRVYTIPDEFKLAHCRGMSEHETNVVNLPLGDDLPF